MSEHYDVFWFKDPTAVTIDILQNPGVDEIHPRFLPGLSYLLGERFGALVASLHAHTQLNRRSPIVLKGPPPASPYSGPGVPAYPAMSFDESKLVCRGNRPNAKFECYLREIQAY